MKPGENRTRTSGVPHALGDSLDLRPLPRPVPRLGGARNARAQSGPHTETFEILRETASAPVLDDLEGLLARGRIRVAVTYSKTHYLWTTSAPDTRADPAA